MLRLIRALALASVLLTAALAALAYLAIERRPAVSEPAGLSRQEIERVERLLRENDPRTLRGPTYRTLALTAADLSALAGYLAERLGGAAAKVSLGPGEVQLRLTLALPSNPVGGYLNLVARLGSRDSTLVPRELAVGRVPVPSALARWGWSWLERRLDQDPTLRLARQAVREVRIGPDALRVRYEWRPELADAARDQLVPEPDRRRLAHYQQRLVETLSQTAASGHGAPIATLIQSLGSGPPVSPGADLAADNRALLVVVAAHALGRDLRLLAPEARPRPRGGTAPLRLRGRVDLAQHFLGSAALSATGGAGIADAIGLSKELADSTGGSGFSFTDLAANRAGVRFGEAATSSPASAEGWRRRVRDGFAEDDVMPRVDDLPEFLPDREFRARFGGVGSPPYQALIDEIGRRVSAAPFYR